MKYIIIVFSLISISTFAQKNIEKTVGEFKELKVYDLIKVELIKASTNKIVISGKNNNNVIINNKNGTLKIKMKLEEAFNGNETKVKLYYTAVDVIDANEGSKIYSKDTIEQFEVDLNAQEGASISVTLDVRYVNVRAVTGADVTATGKAEHQDVSIYTGGDYKGQQLKTEFTEVSIRAAGEAYIYATKKVVAKVRAGGNIYIYGNPEHVTESKVLGGKIKRITD